MSTTCEPKPGTVFEKDGKMTTRTVQQRLELPVTPEVRARTLLAALWQKYDAGGTSMGRSHEAVLLEAAIALLGSPDGEEMRRLDSDYGGLVDQTRDYLSARQAVEFGLALQQN